MRTLVVPSLYRIKGHCNDEAVAYLHVHDSTRFCRSFSAGEALPGALRQSLGA